jgi:hypothetical protein
MDRSKKGSNLMHIYWSVSHAVTMAMLLGVLITVIIIAAKQSTSTNVLSSRIRSSVVGGVPDANMHRFVGKVLRRVPGLNCNGFEAYSAGCSGNLVEIPGLPSRRLLVSAGHCAIPANLNFLRYITFEDVVDATFHPTCSPGLLRYTQLNLAKFHRIKKVWSTSDGSNVEFVQNDYSVMLLDTEVNATIVPYPAILGISATATSLKQSDIPTLGYAGYGYEGYGPDGEVGPGQPIPIFGDLNKKYAESETAGISPHRINIKSPPGTNATSFCDADSGAGGFTPSGSEPFVIWGVASAGPQPCRGFAAFARVDTPGFRAWLSSIAADILATASL